MSIKKQNDHGLRRSRDTSFNIVTGYRLGGWGLIPSTGKICLSYTASRLSLRTIQATSPMGTGGAFPGGKPAGT
jgi:hypothetical protein